MIVPSGPAGDFFVFFAAKRNNIADFFVILQTEY